MEFKRNIGLLLIGLLLCICYLAGCSDVDTSTSDNPTPISPTPTPTIEQQIQQIAQGASISEYKITTKYQVSTNTITVKDDIGERWDNGAFKDAGKSEIFKIQQALWQSSIHPKDVTVIILGPLLDKYGKSSTGEVMHGKLVSETAAKFQRDNLNSDSAWDVYDDTWMLPSIQNG